MFTLLTRVPVREDIEQQVTKKLEGAVAGLSSLDTLQSTSSENMAMLVIRFTNDTDMDQAMTDLRDKRLHR